MIENPHRDGDVETAKSAIFELLSQEQIAQIMRHIRTAFDINLDRVKISSTKPGEDLFDRYEIQDKLLRVCDSDFEQLKDKIISHGFDPNTLSIDDLRKIAKKESITIEGKLPGFAMAAGDDEIIFFAVSGENAPKMATQYAAKEGEPNMSFNTTAEAIKYLGGLAKKALFHEVAHIIYTRGDFSSWDDYIKQHSEIRDHVIEIQQDKYADVEQIPVAEEAFADFAIEVLSNGELISRLGKNDEAANKMRSLIKRNQ